MDRAMRITPRSVLTALLATGVAVGHAGCAAPRPSPSASTTALATVERDPWPPSGPVDGRQAQELVKRGAILVDVRTEEAFTVEKLPGALSLPIEELEQAQELFEPKSRPIVVYCGAGIQSAAAAKQLAAMGFTHVYDLGPMFGWRHGDEPARPAQ
jgi:rhodanese-related sulfurtransferase